MYNEEDFLMLSALQHFLFCSRQCALIHIEQIWLENLFTAEGRVMHDRAHEERFEKRPGVRIERGIPLRSRKLGLIGIADIVEFHKIKDRQWLPFPVEYKRGKPKMGNCDKVQLCAQAICLEEMLKVGIPAGAIFYGRTRHRLDVEFTEKLRRETEETAYQLHQFLKEGKTPKAEYEKKCESCSLIEVCMPKISRSNRSVADYFEEALKI